MGRESFELKIRAVEDRARHVQRARGRRAQPRHPRVDFQVDAEDTMTAARLLVEKREEIRRVDVHRDVELDDARDFLLDDRAENEDRAGDASLAEVKGLAGVSDAP